MHPNSLKDGDIIEVRIGVDGGTFKAIVVNKLPKVLAIYPDDPITYQARFCSYSAVVRVLERPGVAA